MLEIQDFIVHNGCPEPVGLPRREPLDSTGDYLVLMQEQGFSEGTRCPHLEGRYRQVNDQACPYEIWCFTRKGTAARITFRGVRVIETFERDGIREP